VMQLQKTFCKRLLIFVSLFIFCLPVAAQATLSLRVSPTDGGNTLRFGRIDSPSRINKEVSITISTSEDKQYQVYQRVVEPFVNERGEYLDRDVIQATTSPGSNTMGTLQLQSIERLTLSDQLLYTSNDQGFADDFILIYQVDPEDVALSGNFLGKILYTLRPVGSSDEDQVVLNVSLEAQSSDFTFDIETSSSGDMLRLDTDSELEETATVKFTYAGNRSELIKIYQEISQWPINESGQSLERDALIFSNLVVENGNVAVSDNKPIAQQRTLLYESDASSDEVELTYALSQQVNPLSGSYGGFIQFIVESAQHTQEYNLDLSVRIAPIFEITAQYPKDGMVFKRLLPDSAPQLKEVVVNVQSNLGRPYAVGQNTSGLLTNEEGKQINQEYFTIKEELVIVEGSVENEEFIPIVEGDMPLFYSDKNGTSSEFKVIYRLKPYKNMNAGDYRTAVVYSLSEI